MKKSSKLDIGYIAKLAHLHLTPEEETLFSRQLADILGHIDKLRELDLKDIPPTFQAAGTVDVTRKDLVDRQRVLSQEEALANAPDKERGFFRVPKVL